MQQSTNKGTSGGGNYDDFVGGNQSGVKQYTTLPITSNDYGQVRYTDETRSKNTSVKLWKRIN